MGLARVALSGAVLLALAGIGRAQLALNWTRNYELPEATDGDCVTDALAHLSDGRVVASTRTYSPAGVTRFVQYTLTGAQAWSRLHGPSSQTFYPAALVDALDAATFVGLSTSSAAPGISLVSLAQNGSQRWTALVPAQVDSNSGLRAALGHSGEVFAATSEGAGAGPTLWLGFSRVGAPLFAHRVELDPAANERVRDAVVLSSGLVIAADVGSRAVVAQLAPGGVVRWRNETSGAAGLGADIGGLDVDASDPDLGERLGAAGVAIAANGQREVWLRTLSADGLTLRTVQVSLGGAPNARVRDVRFASDGALWAGGWNLDLAGRGHFFAVRWPKDGSGARWFEWLPGSGSPQHTLLWPGRAGQMWAATPYFAPGAAERVALLQLTHDLPSTVAIRTEFGDGVEARMLRAGALFAGDRLVLGGRSDQFLSGPIFFDPLAWVAQFDVRGAPDGYCTSQSNSLGCAPQLIFSGAPSVGASAGFELRVERLGQQRSGLYFYGAGGAANTPWQGGTLCIAGQLRRAPLLDTGGAPNLACSGALALDWNSFAAGVAGGAPGPELTQIGATIRVQALVRDPQAASGVNVSSALRYVVLP